LTGRTPKFLVDESCDFCFVRSLRQNGYDVKAIVEVMSGASDLVVLQLGFEENRVLLTEDKDFGEWIFAHKNATAGVILLRYPSQTRVQMNLALVELVGKYSSRLENSYVVLEPGRARIRTANPFCE